MIINLIILNSHSTVSAFLNIIRFRGVMVSTQDFESCDPGSIPGGTFFFLTIAQLAEQWTVNPFVGCSIHPSENIVRVA
jgi:hypothetical protein